MAKTKNPKANKPELNKSTEKNIKQPVQKKNETNNSDFFDTLNQFIDKRKNLFFWVTFALSIICTLLVFDLKVSVGGDDSAYIIRAYDLVNDFKYPTFQGPLYPMILSVAIAFFGINIPVLKFISFIFIVLHFFFFYKIFCKRIPSAVLFPVMLIMAINPYLLYYGSQTYSEALFMFEQTILFYMFFKYFIETDTSAFNLKADYKKFLWLGLILFIMGITRTIGLAGIFIVVVYFLFSKQFKPIIYTLLTFFGFIIIWEIAKRIIWNSADIQFATQGDILLNKEPYDASAGRETIGGYIIRFFENSNLYLSKHFFKFFGLRPEITDPLPFLTIFTIVLFIIALYVTYRNNKFLFFTGLYSGIMLSFTFIVLQRKWEAGRMIIPFFPLTLLFLFASVYSIIKDSKKLIRILTMLLIAFIWLIITYTFCFEVGKEAGNAFSRIVFVLVSFILAMIFYYFFSNRKKIVSQLFYIVFTMVFFIGTIYVSISKISEKTEVLKANFNGDMLYGFTPDWVNFIKMSQWAAENTPKNVMIASRKPDISFIYTNRRFWGMFKVPSENADTLLDILKKNNVKYVIMASLRKFEQQKTEYTINTEMRYLYYIQQKYPKAIRMVHTIGTDETATLFEIK